LNLTLGPLSFQLLRLPILHDFGVFFTLLLVVWVTGRFGTSTLAGVIGSILAIMLAGPVLIVCFAAAALLFDLLMFASHHKIRNSKYTLAVAVISTVVSAYFAGVLIGAFFTPGQTFQWALTIWGGWHVIGGILAVVVTLPIILLLERAHVRKLKGDTD
jgi:integral membrane sensor domain MASE1